jgi:hypothetical protein
MISRSQAKAIPRVAFLLLTFRRKLLIERDLRPINDFEKKPDGNEYLHV